MIFESPLLMIYERVPGGVGYSETIYANQNRLLSQSYELIRNCSCEYGCPGCVGSAGEKGIGAKTEALEILRRITLEK